MSRFIRLLIMVVTLPLTHLAAQVPPTEQGQTRDPEPLFASNDLLVMTLEARLKTTLDERGEDREYHPAILRYEDPESGPVSLNVRVRVRGNFRAQSRNCRFPPLRVDMRKAQTEQTVFAGQGRLRLVTHCQDRGGDRTRYVLQEYLAYRVYNLLTELSVRVRLARITYVDTETDQEPFTRYAFFLEDYRETAARNGWQLLEVPQMPPNQIDPQQLALFEVFQFMIANTDWSVAHKEPDEDYCCHNAVMVGTMIGPVFPVPFDFDWAGVVDARYAMPDARLNIRSVRQRKFWGICKPRVVVEGVFPRFTEKREDIYDLYRTQEGLEEDQVRKTIDYYDDFYSIIHDGRQQEREIFAECRGH
jgi:hypothetical protein